MNEADAIGIVQSAIWTALIACGPAVGAAMFVGIGIALLQALTQVPSPRQAYWQARLPSFTSVAATQSCMPW